MSIGPLAGTIAAVNPRLVTRVLLVVIIAAYATIGVLYAALTPIWQVPDEPAHYNYIRALGDDRDFPVIEPGDYDQAYLGRLTTDGFPPQLPIEPLEYEDHQPPLYYLLATPIFRLFEGAVLPLRLLSVLFGVGILVVASGAVRAIFTTQPALALMATGLIAFIPTAAMVVTPLVLWLKRKTWWGRPLLFTFGYLVLAIDQRSGNGFGGIKRGCPGRA